MGTSKQIPPSQWRSYFDEFTRAHLLDPAPSTATSRPPDDPRKATSARLLGLSYDPRSNAFEVWLQDEDHLVFHPREIWVVEEEGGFLSALEIGTADQATEVLYLRREGAPVRPDPQPSVQR
jgi:hypothetical protein